MEFKVNSGIWGNMFGVPHIIADNLLKIATGEQLKVLLYMLRNSGKALTNEEISVNTGVSVHETEEALVFWQKVNILSEETTLSMPSAFIPPSSPAPAETHTENIIAEDPLPPPYEPETDKPLIIKPEAHNHELRASEIAEIIESSPDVAELFQMAESALGTLNHSMQNTLIRIYNYMGLKKEVILTLIYYCISCNKSNPAYIEKVAYTWHEQEINSLEAAQEEVERLTKSNDFTWKIMSVFEMKRRPTSKQQDFINKWQNEGYNIELIRYAYEKTIEQIDKLSFEYIDKILISWKQSGFISRQNVKDAEMNFKGKRKSKYRKNFDDEEDDDVEKYNIVINRF